MTNVSEVSTQARARALLARTGTSRAPLAGVLIASTAFLVFAWWEQHPAGLQSVDESLYAMMALRDLRALTAHSLSGVVAILTHSGANAPLVPLLAAPFLRRDPLSTATVLVHIPFVWMLVVAAHSIYKRVASPRVALVGTIVTVATPGILIWSRSVHFAVPLTATLTASTAALLASRRLASWRWSLTWGGFIGLALLTRTVAIALVPGLVIAAVILAAKHTAPRIWIRNLMLGLAMATAVAAPWYSANFSTVFAYLTSNGYAQTSAFSDHQTPGQWGFWTSRLSQVIGQDILIPLAILGLAIVVVALFRSRVPPKTPAIAPIVATVVWYYLALTSSRNVGTAFTLPLAPLLIAIVLHFAGRLDRRQAVGAGAVALLVAAFNVVVAVIPLGRVSLMGDLAVMDGRSATDAQVMAALGAPNAVVADPVALGRAMRNANCAIGSRGRFGPILVTRSDALISPTGIDYCAQSVLNRQPFVGYPGCSGADTACVADVIRKFGFPTVVTGQSSAPYPGVMREEAVIPSLTAYLMVDEFKFGSGEVVRVWARTQR